MIISKDKKYTSDGYPAEVLRTDLKGLYPVLTVITRSDVGQHPRSFTERGSFNEDGRWHSFDLVEVPARGKVFIGFTKGGPAGYLASRTLSDRSSFDGDRTKYISIQEVEVVEEEGL